MTGKERFLMGRILNLCCDAFGPAFLDVECSPSVSPESSLFPITVWLDSELVDGADVAVKRTFRTMADLEHAAKSSLPR